MELSRPGEQGKSQGHRTREEPSHLKTRLFLTSKNFSTVDKMLSEGQHGDKAFSYRGITYTADIVGPLLKA